MFALRVILRREAGQREEGTTSGREDSVTSPVIRDVRGRHGHVTYVKAALDHEPAENALEADKGAHSQHRLDGGGGWDGHGG